MRAWWRARGVERNQLIGGQQSGQFGTVALAQFGIRAFAFAALTQQGLPDLFADTCIEAQFTEHAFDRRWQATGLRRWLSKSQRRQGGQQQWQDDAAVHGSSRRPER